jgi:hypothetical protein
MIGIAEMFAEFDGYESYEIRLAAWAVVRRCKMREYHRDRYRDPVCRARTLSYLKAWRRSKRVSEGRAPDRKIASHGTRSKYVGGCRCDACRSAETEYRRNRRQQIKEAA